jgi:hypothetical protein
VALNIMLGCNLESAGASRKESWLLAPLEFIEEGFVARRMSAWVVPTVERMSQAAYEYWGEGRWQVNGVGPFVRPADGEEAAFRAAATAHQIDCLPWMTWIPIEGGTDLDPPAVFSMLMYAAIKTPGRGNEEGFMARRPMAAARAVNRYNTAGEPEFPQSLIPALNLYHGVSTILVGSPAIRIGLCRVLAGFVFSNSVPLIHGVMISQVRIWRGHQLGSFNMVRDLVLAYGPVLRGVRALTPALEAFDAHLARYVEVAREDPLVEFRAPIYGPLNDMKAIRPYTMLTMYARDLLRLTATSDAGRRQWRQFAADIPPDLSYEAELQARAEALGVTLPRRVVEGTSAHVDT